MSTAGGDLGSISVDLVVPVHDEEAVLGASIERLHAYATAQLPVSWRIVIAENGSSDRTVDVARELAARLSHVVVRTSGVAGRGGALRDAWTTSDRDLLAYMDVDLSTGLEALLPLLAPLISGHSDIATGTRLAPGSSVVRGPKREAISRAYNLLLRLTLRAGFSDAQCGFKAIRRDVAEQLLPLVHDDGWFFDAELLILAEHNGYRIYEVPVEWVDDPDSSVVLGPTMAEAWHGLWRMVRRLGGPDSVVADRPGRSAPNAALAEQLVRFGSIGLISTIGFAVLFAILREPLGVVGADVVSLAVCAVLNTAANRRLTFDLRGRSGWVRHQARTLLLTSAPLALNLAAIAVLEEVGVSSLAVQLGVLTIVNGFATVGRFLLLRSWVFRPYDGDGARRSAGRSAGRAPERAEAER